MSAQLKVLKWMVENPGWRYGPEIARGSNWHTDGYCVKCETTRPLKASGELTHKAGDVCQVCGGIWQSVSNVGGVAHVCPGSPLNG